MNQRFREYLDVENDGPILSALAELWAARVVGATATVVQRRERAQRAARRLAEAEVFETESRARLAAVIERQERLHKAAATSMHNVLTDRSANVTTMDDTQPVGEESASGQ